MMAERGISSFSLFSRKKGVMDLLSIHKGKDSFEVTVQEMIPERSTVEPKKVAKADTLVKKAEMVLSKGDLKHGEQFLIQALALDPSNIEIYHKLGLLYLKNGQFGKAENMYQKLISSAHLDPVFFSNLGVALYQQKKLEEAKVNYKKAIELDATRPGRFFSLAQVMKELGEVQEALEHFKKAVEMDKGNLDYLLTLAQAYLEADLRAEARLLLDDIVAAFPENQDAKDMMKRAGEV